MRGCVLALVAVLTGTASADPRDPVHLRLGTLAIDGSRYMTDILALSRDIAKRTRGDVVLDWVSGGQLGEEADMAALVARGKLDGGGFSETGLAALVPEMAAWGRPAQFRSYEDVDQATAALDPAVRELFAQNQLVFAMWADLGFARLFSNEPIETLNGAVAAARPFLGAALDGKLIEAIVTGKARAWVVPPLYQLAITGAKARYMTNLEYRYVVGGLVLSAAAWARLSAEDRRIVADTCRAYEPKLRASWRKETVRAVAALGKAGVTLRAASDAQLAAFLDKLAAATPCSKITAQGCFASRSGAHVDTPAPVIR
jgi:TRAP-type C4-dicarboxylate transport system substrate-binding protein